MQQKKVQVTTQESCLSVSPQRGLVFSTSTLWTVWVFSFRMISVFPSEDFWRHIYGDSCPTPPPPKKKKSWLNCCRGREALSVSVSLRCFQRWQRLWEDNTVQHGCPKPDQRGDNQSQSKSFYRFACSRPTWGGVLLSTQLFPRRSQTRLAWERRKHEHWTGGVVGRT